MPVEAHEVAEAPALDIESVIQERGVSGSARADARRTMTQLLQHQRQHQSAGVVVRAIAFGEIRDGETGVLKNSSRIAHAEQMVELQLGQLSRLLVQRFDGRHFSSHETV